MINKPFPSPVNHFLSELSTMTHPSWVAQHSMTHSFIELDKAVIRFVSFLWLCFQSVCPLMEKERLWKLPDGRDLLMGSLGLVLMGRAMLSKSLIQFYVDGWGYVPSLLFTWGQTKVEVIQTRWRSFKDGEAVYSHQKQDQEITVALIMHSLLSNSDLNWRK